ncbi:MAG: hypothetical protein ACLGJB_14320 [Blastocatellia bacterium]
MRRAIARVSDDEANCLRRLFSSKALLAGESFDNLFEVSLSAILTYSGYKLEAMSYLKRVPDVFD